MGIKIKYLDLNCAYSKRIEDYKFYVKRCREGEDVESDDLLMVRVCGLIECARRYGEVGEISIENLKGETVYHRKTTQGDGDDLIFVSKEYLQIKNYDGKVIVVLWEEMYGIGIDVEMDIREDLKLPRSNGSPYLNRDDVDRILVNLKVDDRKKVSECYGDFFGFDF